MNKFILLLSIIFFFKVANAQQKEWTMLVFLNGHNNLDSFGDLNINQMEQFGSTDQINMVVQRASTRTQDTQRLFITKGVDQNRIESPVVQSLPRVDMGDYKQFIDFVLWGTQNFPAKKYFVVIWNHGSGWHSLLNRLGMAGGPTADISNDDYTNNKITTVEMGYAFKFLRKQLGSKIELYGSDACLMQMLEISYEIKEGVKFVVGSQELEPGAGWPYHRFIKRWAQNPYIDGGELGTILTEEYLNEYPDQSTNPFGTTLSVVDNAHVDAVVENIKHFKRELLNVSNKTLLANAATGTQSFYYNDYKDLYHFMMRLSALNAPINKSVVESLQISLMNYIVNYVNNEDKPNAYGTSIWIPSYKYYYEQHQSAYSELAFEKETGWSEFLRTIH